MTATAIAMALGCSTLAMAAEGGKEKLSKAEETFLKSAAIDNMTEIQMSQLAQQQAQDQQVKQFAQMMVQDHTKASEQLKQVADAKGVKVPKDLPKDRDEEIDALKSLQGREFDQAYMSHMKAAHLKDVSRFSDKAQTAKDPEVKAFAAQMVPQLQQHQQHAITLATAQGLPADHVTAAASGGAHGGMGTSAQPAGATIGGSSSGSGASGSTSGGASGSGASGSTSGGGSSSTGGGTAGSTPSGSDASSPLPAGSGAGSGAGQSSGSPQNR